MKIGILTYHDTTNYGAILQTYSLVTKINEMKSICEVVQYECEAITNREVLFSKRKKITLKSIIKLLLIGMANVRKYKKFKAFSHKNIPMSSTIYNSKNKKSIESDYDKLIVGSDQVWNINLSGYDYTFFLDFVENDKKKYSYAASFGYSIVPEIGKKETCFYLKKFNKISVREKDGVNIVRELTGLTPRQVVDPIFLYDGNFWIKFSENHLKREKYILLYLIQDRKKTIEFAKRVASKYGLNVVYVNISPYYIFGVENIRDATPQEFVSLVVNADYIITGSFHGVAYAINLNKNFVFEPKKNANNYNSRIDSLLNIFGLEDRILKHDDYEIKQINYSLINDVLEEERSRAVCFLEEIVND